MTEQQLSIFDFLSEENSPLVDSDLPIMDIPESVPVYSDEAIDYFYSSSMDIRGYEPEGKRELAMHLPADNILLFDTVFFQDIRHDFLSFFFSHEVFSGKEKDYLKQKLDVDDLTYEHLYVPTFQVDDFEHLPFPNLSHYKEKMHNFLIQSINSVTEGLDKTIEDNNLSIFIPDELFNTLSVFVSDFPVDANDLPEEYDKELYLFLFNYYYIISSKHIARYQDSLSAQKMKEFTSAHDVCRTYFQGNNAFIHYNPDKQAIILSDIDSIENTFIFASKLIVTFFQLLYFLTDALPLVSQFKQEVVHEQRDVSDSIAMFIDKIKSERLFPVEDIPHKTAQKKAENKGLTHLFLPFSNKQPLFKTETPVLVDLSRSSENDNKIIPFYSLTVNDDNHAVHLYKGFYDSFPIIASRAHPHVTGDTFEVGYVDDDFSANLLPLLKEEDPELAHIVEQSLDIIDSHRLVRNKMEALFYEENKEDENIVQLYDATFNHRDLVCSDNFIVRPKTIDGKEVCEHKLYHSEGEYSSFYINKINQHINLNGITFTFNITTPEADTITVGQSALPSISEGSVGENRALITTLLNRRVSEIREKDGPYSFAAYDVDRNFFLIHNGQYIDSRKDTDFSSYDTYGHINTFIREINNEHNLFDEPFFIKVFLFKDLSRDLKLLDSTGFYFRGDN